MIPDAGNGGGEADRATPRGPGDLDAVGAVAAVGAGTTTADALLADARRRIGAWEPLLGAVVAESSEPAPAGGPLAGMVIGVKDLFAVRGLVRGCGAPGLVPETPQAADAAVVGRLRERGAVIAATTQTHQFAYGIITPQTRNPRAPGRVAGGSSGGSAAAIAAGLVHAALGTDTGGSIRIPASCCGVVGLKPTYGALPLDGVQPLAPSLDTAGPMAATVADTALLLSALTGRSSDIVPVPRPRIGVPAQTRAGLLDPQVRAMWDEALRALQDAGAQVRDVALPALADAPRANGILLGLEALRTHAGRLDAGGDGWWPTVRDRLERARRLARADEDAARAVGESLRAELTAAFTEVDVLVLPTLPCPPPAVGADTVDVDGVEEAVTPALTRLTNPWNLTGVPAGSVPAGRDRQGAPLGLQVVGPWGGEQLVLAVMALAEDVLGGPWPSVSPPGPRSPAP